MTKLYYWHGYDLIKISVATKRPLETKGLLISLQRNQGSDQ